MTRTIGIVIVIAGLGLGGVGVWILTGDRSTPQVQAQAPRLEPDRPQSESAHIPRGQVTDERITEATEANEVWQGGAEALEEGTKAQRHKGTEGDGEGTKAQGHKGTEHTIAQPISPMPLTSAVEPGPVTAMPVASLHTETPQPVSTKPTPAQGQREEVIEVPGPAVQDPAAQAAAKAQVAAKPRIAVLPFKVIASDYGVPAQTGEILCDAVVSEIDSDRYEVYERLQLASLMEEKGFQTSTLVDSPEGVARFSRMAGVSYVVLGSLARLGGQYHLNARLVDCSSGKVGQRGSVEFTSMTQWSAKVPELVNILALRQGTWAPSPGAGVNPATGNDLISCVNPGSGFAVSIRTKEDKQVYTEGEYIRFKVSAEKDCFITLITVDSQGAMTLLLPNKWQSRAFIRRGTELVIPSDEMGFRFPIKPPHGETLVKAIATLQPLVLSGVNTKGIEEQGFAALPIGVKAIGVEAVPQAPVPPAPELAGLAALLQPGQWATDELIVLTVAKEEGTKAKEEGTKAQRGTGTEGGGAGNPFDLRPAGGDINDKILKRFGELMQDTIQAPNLVLQGPADLQPQSGQAEVLVCFRDGRTIRKVQADSVGQTGDQVNIAAVVPNLKLYAYGLPQTRLVQIQWALENRFGPGMDLDIATKYDSYTNRIPALIGLVDGPVDWADPRIAQAAWANPREVPGNGRDDDGNGFVDDVHGYNFVIGSVNLCPNPQQFNHGTALVSIMAGRVTGSDLDVIGIAPQARIITAVVLADEGQPQPWRLTSTLEQVIRGITYVADQGAKVINCSFGTRIDRKTLDALNRIPLWDRLQEQGVTLVCAAGNEDLDIDEQPVFPACLPRPNVIAVAATDAAGRPATLWDPSKQSWVTFTNRGPRTIDISAPGSLILAATGRGKVDLVTGTSYAAALVTAMESQKSGVTK